MFYYLKILNIHVKFAEMNANLIVIHVTFAKPGFTMTNKLPEKVLQNLGKVKGLFWKSEESLDKKKVIN